jgi:5'-3' exonuclease
MARTRTPTRVTVGTATKPTNNMQSKVLVDGDLIVYRAGWATEKTKYLVTDSDGKDGEVYDTAKEANANDAGLIWSRKDLKDESEAIMLVDIIMRDIQARYDEGKLYVFLTTEQPTFRDAIAKRRRYKAGRSNRPAHYGAIRQHLVDEWGATITHNQEADDAIGIAADPDSIIVSFDKDLDQIEGTHYDWTKKEEYTVGRRNADLFFYTQVLAGDPTDTVPGIEGVGPQKAAGILQGVKGCKEAWQRCLDTYIQYYGDEGLMFALETARLVYVRRRENELWEPPV